MKFLLSICFVFFVMASCSQGPNYLCDGFAQSEISRVMVENGASELGEVIANAMATEGSLVLITAGVKSGDSSFVKIVGGSIGDPLFESSIGNENEYGKIHLDGDVSYLPSDIASIRANTAKIVDKFDQNDHKFALRNKFDTKDIMDFSTSFPRSFHFENDCQEDLVLFNTTGLNYTWEPQSGTHKTFILLHFPGGGINPDIESTVWKAYPVEETGRFLIPSSELVSIHAKIGLTYIIRVNALNVPDLRAPNHLNAVVLMSNRVEGIDLTH
jgi:hypothetical protein